jgi:hypothetical protein
MAVDVKSQNDPVTETTMLRCDRCIAWAVSRVVMESGSKLYFCSHHMTQHFPMSQVHKGVTITPLKDVR